MEKYPKLSVIVPIDVPSIQILTPTRGSFDTASLTIEDNFSDCANEVE